MMSRFYVHWVTSLFGDPLYRPDLRKTRLDETPPRVAKAEDVAVTLSHAAGEPYATVRATLEETPGDPELVLAAVEYWKAGEKGSLKKAVNRWYARRPAVILPALEPGTGYAFRLVLTDPYGNTFDSAAALGELTFRTGPAPPPRAEPVRINQRRRFWIGGPTRKDRINNDAGEIDFIYEPGTGAIAHVIHCGGLWLSRPGGGKLRLEAGGGYVQVRCDFQPGRPYRLILRYRSRPVTRELWLVAADGRRFCLGADNRTPWAPMSLDRYVYFAGSDSHGYVREATMWPDCPVGSAASTADDAVFDLSALEAADKAAKAAEKP